MKEYNFYIIHFCILCIFFFKLIYLFWERQRENKWGRGRESGRDRIPSRFCAVSMESDVGLKLTNHEILTWAEIKSRTLNWVSHADAPLHVFLKECSGGTWVAQSVKCPTSAQVMISPFMSSSPMMGSVLTAQSPEPASDSCLPPLCPSPAYTASLSVSKNE